VGTDHDTSAFAVATLSGRGPKFVGGYLGYQAVGSWG
jgi:hypothetical protein